VPVLPALLDKYRLVHASILESAQRLAQFRGRADASGAPTEQLTSPLVVEFRVDPQCRAAMWLRWSSVRSAKVELQNFNLESAGGRDDRREISAGRATGEGW